MCNPATPRFPLLAGSLLACLVATAAPGQITPIAQAAAGEQVHSMLSHQRSIARTSDGRLWSLVYVNDGKNTGASTHLSQFLRLHASPDNGKTWLFATALRTTGAIRGSLATDVDGRTLHVVWQASNGAWDSTNSAAINSVYYAAFDTRTMQWRAADLQLAAGANANSQFLAPVVDVTRGGTVSACYYTHRQGPWNGMMQLLQNSQWTPAQRVNVDTYGVLINQQAQGEDIHFSYRTNAGLYGIRYRRYDGAAQQWGAEGEVQVSQANSSLSGTASSGNCIAVAATGDTYVAYAGGAATAGQGTIWVGCALAGTYQFNVHHKVSDDAALLGGNHSYYNYALAVSDGRAYIVYSLLSEQNANLYMRWFVGTSMFPPQPITLATGSPRQFEWLAGHRAGLGRHALMATATDLSGTPAGAQAQFYGQVAAGAIVPHGRGCAGSRPAVPFLAAASTPGLGQGLPLDFSDLPATVPGLLFLGIDDRNLGPIPLPLDLTGLGMAGCWLYQDLLVSVGFASNAQGTATLTVPLPNDPRLGGLPIYFQGFIVAPGANQAGAVMANGIAAIAR